MNITYSEYNKFWLGLKNVNYFNYIYLIDYILINFFLKNEKY